MRLPLHYLGAALGGLTLANAQNFTWDHSLYTSVPPVYPSPATQGVGWEGALARAKAFVSNLTLDEKVLLVSGVTGPCVGNVAPIPRLGFSGICLQDGPLAIRQATYASVFPAGLTTAASWDKSLMYTRGLYIGEEFKGKGAHVALGPVVGPLGRSAYDGRNWEGFSPDPYLTGVAAELTITGTQDSGVQACIKHFIGYEQETQRFPTTTDNGTVIFAISSNIDDRTIHELYLWPFANAVRSGVSSVMCSYNRVNSTYSCENSKTLNGLLKEELFFQGYVVSDWGGTHSGVPAILAGEDQDMPGGAPWGGNITLAVNNGSVSIDRLNDMCTRVMTPYFNLNQDKYPPVDPTELYLNSVTEEDFDYYFPVGNVSNVDVRGNHSTLIRELGAAGTVLLKNVGGALPLKKPKNIAVFGNDAGDIVDGMYSLGTPFDQVYGFEYGTLSVGGGSGTGRLSYLVPPLDAIKARTRKDGTFLQYMLNNTLITSNDFAGLVAPTPPEVCLLFLKTWSQEGVDRISLLPDWNSTAVVKAVTSICNNTIVITHSGGLNVLPWADNPNITAILASHLPGEESGNSIVDVLYGEVNPSGKLPYTIALEEDDYSFAPVTNSTALAETTDPDAWQSDFKEGLLIDYRHFDYYNESVAYEFGYGLSYTTFNMSTFSVSKVYSGGNITSTPPSASPAPGGNPRLWDVLFQATLKVTNTGSVAGATVPQLYVSLPQIPGEQPTPVKVLRGFEKISLQPGETSTVTFDLMRRDLSYWSVFQQEWIIPSTSIGVMAGFSSRDIKFTSSLKAY